MFCQDHYFSIKNLRIRRKLKPLDSNDQEYWSYLSETKLCQINEKYSNAKPGDVFWCWQKSSDMNTITNIGNLLSEELYNTNLIVNIYTTDELIKCFEKT